jgi:hypothetical protein
MERIKRNPKISTCRPAAPCHHGVVSCVPRRRGVVVPPIAVVLPPIKPMLDSLALGSIKKGQKIRKGKNQKKSKDIAVAKLYY